jgi:hypothetical protein
MIAPRDASRLSHRKARNLARKGIRKTRDVRKGSKKDLSGRLLFGTKRTMTAGRRARNAGIAPAGLLQPIQTKSLPLVGETPRCQIGRGQRRQPAAAG